MATAPKNDNITEVARKYGIGPNMICNWKKQLERKIGMLEQMIGKKDVELNAL